LAEKETWKKAPEVPPEAKAIPENWEVEKEELVKKSDEAMAQAKVELAVPDLKRYPLTFL